MLLPIASSESIDGNQNVVSTRSKSLGRVVSTETHGLHAQVLKWQQCVLNAHVLRSTLKHAMGTLICDLRYVRNLSAS